MRFKDTVERREAALPPKETDLSRSLIASDVQRNCSPRSFELIAKTPKLRASASNCSGRLPHWSAIAGDDTASCRQSTLRRKSLNWLGTGHDRLIASTPARQRSTKAQLLLVRTLGCVSASNTPMMATRAPSAENEVAANTATISNRNGRNDESAVAAIFWG
jgi:hypothetical protein